jgi:hypothetical protein
MIGIATHREVQTTIPGTLAVAGPSTYSDMFNEAMVSAGCFSLMRQCGGHTY